MKRAKLAQRLTHLLLGGLITGLLVASAVVLPAAPAHATNKYLYDFSISEDLSFQKSFFLGEKKDFYKYYKTEDPNKICEKIKSEQRNSLKEYKQEYKRDLGIIQQQVDDCRFQGSLFFIDISGKIDEKLLKNPNPMSSLKIKNKDELELKDYLPFSGPTSDLAKIVKRENIGIIRYTFPGKVKRVNPEIGKISGNAWSQEKPLTAAERNKTGNNNDRITITAERYGSKLGLILGITIPAALVIVAVIVLLVVRSNRKQKQQNLPPYQAGYGAYPPPPFMPGNPVHPAPPRVPGYPVVPGTPGVQETAPSKSGGRPAAPGASGIPAGQPPMPGGTKSPISGALTPGGYPPPYGSFPAPPAMPGNPAQASTPGYSASGTPGMPGGASYPPNVPPQAQPGAPLPGGYYPYQYPYPYPPANPQTPGGWQPPMPNQANGTRTPGFQPPAAAPQPGESEKPDDPNQAAGSHSGKHVATSPQPGQSGQPAKSPTPPPSEEVGKPGNPDKSNQDTDSSKPRHAFEPEQSDLTVLSTDSSKLMRPRHSTPVNQVEQPGQKN